MFSFCYNPININTNKSKYHFAHKNSQDEDKLFLTHVTKVDCTPDIGII